MCLLFRVSIIALALVIGTGTVLGHRSKCRVIPGDLEWPEERHWADLNSTVHGRLIATVPSASVCHGSMYDGSLCESLKEEWNFPQPHVFTSAEIMSPWYQNQSCDPFTPRSVPCTLGNYVPYSINVTSAEDIRAGLGFANSYNIRLVIKNTGHDYLGRSTGKGGLGLWMQGLRSTYVQKDYKSNHYSGAAMKIGAGVLAADAFLAAHEHGLRVVGGGCPSTGIAGGYTQGGGHSFLSSTHGMSADNVLEWEVVTADGHHIVATPMKHQDLYWALSGGGGGNYGVVLSMTVKAYEDGPVGGAYLSFNSSKIGRNVFWQSINLFHAHLPNIVDAGATALYQMTADTFTMLTLTAPGLTAEHVRCLLSPILSGLTELGVSHVLVPSHAESFYDHFAATFGPLPLGPIPVSDIVSSRLIPRSVMTEQPDKVSRTFRGVLESGNYYLGILALSVDKPRHPHNAVLPAWRSALLQAIVGAPWDWSVPRADMNVIHDKLVAEAMPALEALTPGAGTYMNEGNAEQTHWQREFFGDNYKRLLEIKNRYDPDGVFYATTAVGSEGWTVDGDGRLCRAEKGYSTDSTPSFDHSTMREL